MEDINRDEVVKSSGASFFDNLPENRTRIVVDGRGVCWNATEFALKAYPEVSNVEERYATILWAFFDRLKRTAQRFRTNKFIFAWEGKTNLRKSLYPNYKGNRVPKPTTSEFLTKKRQERKEHRELIDSLAPFWLTIQDEVIPQLGFTNSFSFEGYEGDDIIAMICKNAGNTPIAILSDDSDMYQLISDSVCCVSAMVKSNTVRGRIPSVLDRQKFMKRFNLKPEQWSEFKAVRGCPSDNVPGVLGVGAKYTTLYLNGDPMLKKNGKPITAKLNIELAYKDGTIDLYRKLVKLPFEGTPNVELGLDDFSMEKFLTMCNKYHLSYLIKDEFWADVFGGR